MATYIPKQTEVDAAQWLGHGEDFDLDVDVRQMRGLSGYAAKIGYIQQANGSTINIRPNEFVILSGDGSVKTETPENFLAKYQLAHDEAKKPGRPKKA